MEWISIKLKILFLFPLFMLLFGCSSSVPAPVSSLQPDYNVVMRGSYRGSYYKVEKGDTLYFIAYITDSDVNNIIAANHLLAPFTIHPGQKLNIWKSTYIPPSYGEKGTPEWVGGNKASPPISTALAPKKEPEPVKEKPGSSSQNKKTVEYKKPKEYSPVVTKNKPTAKEPVKKTSKDATIESWLWPSKGRIISGFSSSELGNKGIDIAGLRGQNVIATAKGKVVYAGNALRGYGNLIIIKHNDDYLSAYAHNDRLLVSESQHVKSGQKIALMGSSATNSVRLHFEIRYKGKSVNPLRFLPKR